jgi:hypothetical protein
MVFERPRPVAEPDLSNQLPPAASKLFLSYAREDRDTAQQLAHALGEEGFVVWWDREIRGGSDFTEEIASNLQTARLVLVLWSPTAVRSSFVRDESARARDAGKLLPLRIQETDLPLGFGQIQTLDLIDWDGERDAASFRAVVNAIRQAMGQQVRQSAGPPRRFPLRKLAWLAAGLAIVALGFAGYHLQSAMRERDAHEEQLRENNREAESLFQQGVAALYATDRNLQSARSLLESARELRRGHARTHYYLGDVYAQLLRADLARASFQEALRLRSGLEADQVAIATKQLSLLVAAGEPAAVERPATGPAVPVGSGPPVLASARPGAGASVDGERRGGLPHVPPDAALSARVEPLVVQMFGLDKEGRISATTTLIVDVELTSDAVPLALKKALSLQENMPRDATERATAESGVINTLVLLRGASPVSLRKYADDIRRLIELARPNGPQTAQIADEVEARLQPALKQRPVTWIQIANEAQRPLAAKLAERMREVGYNVPQAENVGDKAPATRSEIRTQGNSDEGLMRWQAGLMQKFGIGEARLTVLRKATPKTDSYEIWLDRELCVTRVVTGCGANHN